MALYCVTVTSITASDFLINKINYKTYEIQTLVPGLHHVLPHRYTSMPNVLTCSAAAVRAFPPLSVGFFLGSRSRIPNVSSDLDTPPRLHVVALRAAGGRHRRRRLLPSRDHQGAVLHQVRYYVFSSRTVT